MPVFEMLIITQTDFKLLTQKQFLLDTAFSTFLANFLSFLSNLKTSSSIPLSLEESKISCLGKELITLDRVSLNELRLIGWLYWGLTPLQHPRSYNGGRWCICISWLSHTSTNTTFLTKATVYFSHMLRDLQRWEAKIRHKEKSPQPGIQLTTTRSWVWHAHHWATQAGQQTYDRARHSEEQDQTALICRLTLLWSKFFLQKSVIVNDRKRVLKKSAGSNGE